MRLMRSPAGLAALAGQTRKSQWEQKPMGTRAFSRIAPQPVSLRVNTLRAGRNIESAKSNPRKCAVRSTELVGPRPNIHRTVDKIMR